MGRERNSLGAFDEQTRNDAGSSSASEAWKFFRALTGNPVRDAKEEQEYWEFLAAISTEYAGCEDPAKRPRGNNSGPFLPAPTRDDEADEDLCEFLRAITTMREGEWDSSKHPRGGYPQNRGYFSPTAGSGTAERSPLGPVQPVANPDHTDRPKPRLFMASDKTPKRDAPQREPDSGEKAQLKTSKGIFNIDIAPAGDRAVHASINFAANKNVESPVLRFIQIIKVTDKNGKPIDWSQFKSTLPDGTEVSEKDRNSMLTKNGWVTDILTWRKEVGPSMFYGDYVNSETMGSHGIGQDITAKMTDRPASQNPAFHSWRFETYVVSLPLRKGADSLTDIPDGDAPTYADMMLNGKGTVLGGVAWGFDFESPTKFAIPRPLEKSSADFTGALNSFKQFHKK